MGGTRDQLIFLPIGGVDARAQLGAFDAAAAQCFLKRDRDKPAQPPQPSRFRRNGRLSISAQLKAEELQFARRF